jgi:hypothetical protein
MIHRWRYRVIGGHTHVRVFCGHTVAALGNCGDLVYRNEEWPDFQQALERCGVQCLPEEEAGVEAAIMSSRRQT